MRVCTSGLAWPGGGIRRCAEGISVAYCRTLSTEINLVPPADEGFRWEEAVPAAPGRLGPRRELLAPPAVFAAAAAAAEKDEDRGWSRVSVTRTVGLRLGPLAERWLDIFRWICMCRCDYGREKDGGSLRRRRRGGESSGRAHCRSLIRMIVFY